MPDKNKNYNSLARDITAVLNPQYYYDNGRFGSLLSPTARKLLLTGVALAALQPDSAMALSLGEIKVKSALGQPFVATATARIGKGESLAANCVTATALPIGGESGGSKLKTQLKGASKPGEYPIEISSATSLYEPMYEIRLQVKCSGTMSLLKNYVVMLSLPMTSSQPALIAKQVGVAKSSQATPVPNPVPVRKTVSQVAVNRREDSNSITNATSSNISQTNATSQSQRVDGIAAGSNYRVQSGDSLSKIAERIEGRPVGSTYQVANLLFEQNPTAFMNGNANQLRAGAIIKIPAASSLADVTAGKRLPVSSPNTVSSNPPANLLTPTTSSAITSKNNSATISSEISTVAETSTSPIPDAATFAYAEVANAPEASPRIAVINAPIEPAAPPYPAAETPLPIIENLNRVPQPVTGAALLQSPVPSNNQPADMPIAAQEPAAEAISSTPHPLLSGGIGMLLGALLASLILGHRKIRGFFLARKKPPTHNSKNIFADIPQTEDEPTIPTMPAVTQQPEEKFKMPLPAIHVSEAAPEAEAEAESIDVNPKPIAEQTVAGAQDNPKVMESPRISLHGSDSDSNNIDAALDFDMSAMEEPLEQLEGHSALDNTAGLDIANGFDQEGTMTTLFDEETATIENESDFPTAELPIVDQIDTDETSNLQSLSECAIVNQDDDLSKTLTQALGLLEQDYEEALTASQILEEAEVQTAFARHASKKH